MNEAERKEKIQQLLNEAQICPTKGRMYIYDQFKKDLLALEPTDRERDDALVLLAKYLNV